ncbi:MAG: hypothetical protein RLZZ214_3519 [Verrucomicrobiota bacterium]|jgi:hypothetical protein
MPWQPQYISFAGDAFTTATETVFVTTDVGNGYLKAMGNRGGPHLLASDWVATHLARWLGLPTFEFALIEVTDIDEIPLGANKQAVPGPAFISKEMSGNVWGGGDESLKRLVNPEDIGKLVVFDTWTRNCDRHPPDLTTRKPNLNNVFLSNEGLPGGKQRLIAMDHTHCFNCGNNLDGRISRIDLVKDLRIYGLFPEFVPFMRDLAHCPVWMDAVDRLRALDQGWVQGIVSSIPDEWEVEPAARTALVEQICDRAAFIHSQFLSLITPHL